MIRSRDTVGNYRRMFIENGWTDGMPIVLPTEERVAEMLTGTDHPPDEIVGRMSVTTHEERFEYTVEKVAVNAVMAGCKPEYMAGARPEHFPVILALAASQEPSMPSSTTSFGRMVIVNGPIRNQIAINSGAGAFSPFNFANSVIGRAYTLMSFNFGNARINENFTATFGNVTNYNNMFAGENEEESPREHRKPFQRLEYLSPRNGYGRQDGHFQPDGGCHERDPIHASRRYIYPGSADSQKSQRTGGFQNQRGFSPVAD